MLNYEALMEYARANGMPIGKTRGVIREYVQTLILKYLYRHALSRKIYFLGGTYLRLIHHFKRFSEDLDFNGEKIARSQFEVLLEHIKIELARENLPCQLKFEYRGNLSSGKIIFSKEVLATYQLADSRGELMIKVEIHQPKWKMKTEEAVINNFGELFPVLTMTPGYIFCEKMLALSTHRRGRHIYDAIMMLSKDFPMDEYVLKENKVALPAKEYLKSLINPIDDAELIKLANSLRPFLFDENDAQYVEKAKFYLDKLIK
ncbi:MAG: nucleotidyl transferase AbiEii/AbiGii toxin family protein [Candidatus Margulisbacteria bacterium]|nr:nucleotidyl transferase AbiEii/AbiGii toxin family protein [Candidatus Margulisiibacteriota bacterium]